MSIWKLIRAVCLLPVTVIVVVPFAIMYRTGMLDDGLPPIDGFPFPLLAAVYVAIGSWLLLATIRQFFREGGGTLAPWDPPQRLVVTGVYRFVRNPMISGVMFVLLGEATLFGSKPLLVWFLIFLALNVIVVPFVEERGLEKRFGESYLLYKRSVPRWIPRIRPWEPPADHEDR